ncbi:hypothetical protein K474DRAFT_1164718 [Panus rudis PR-1116 ss-1]|nr:hypothetical protein K474DRAFT_1164718 [Panus rudis PR-1116 ss-1]
MVTAPFCTSATGGGRWRSVLQVCGRESTSMTTRNGILVERMLLYWSLLRKLPASHFCRPTSNEPVFILHRVLSQVMRRDLSFTLEFSAVLTGRKHLAFWASVAAELHYVLSELEPAILEHVKLITSMSLPIPEAIWLHPTISTFMSIPRPHLKALSVTRNPLPYHAQSGALNLSLHDVLTSLIVFSCLRSLQLRLSAFQQVNAKVKGGGDKSNLSMREVHVPECLDSSYIRGTVKHAHLTSFVERLTIPAQTHLKVEIRVQQHSGYDMREALLQLSLVL